MIKKNPNRKSGYGHMTKGMPLTIRTGAPQVEECKCERLKWLKDGDRRLFCPVCKKMYVICNGVPVEISGDE